MATVGKKHIDPDWWESAWFMRLQTLEKLFFMYLWSRCDHAGVVEPILPILSVHLDKEISQSELDDFVKNVNEDEERIFKDGQKLWFTEFIRFQQKPDRFEPLSGTHGFTKTIAKRLKFHGLYEEAKKKDPILFRDYEKENGVSSVSKPSPSLTEGYPKGKSKSTCRGKRQRRSKRPPPDSFNGTHHNPDISTKPSLFFFKITKQLRKIIPEDARGVSREEMEADVENLFEFLESEDVAEPRAFLIAKAKSTDWNKNSWNDFAEIITNGAAEFVPYQ